MVTAVTVTAHYTLIMLGNYGEILSVDVNISFTTFTNQHYRLS